jgi:hypothetical protein
MNMMTRASWLGILASFAAVMVASTSWSSATWIRNAPCCSIFRTYSARCVVRDRRPHL